MTSSSLRASSARPTMRAALRLDLRDQRRELVAVAPAGEDREALGGKLPGDRRADEVAGADHRRRGVPLHRHDSLRFWDCRFSPKQPLDTAPEKTGPTRGERIFGSFSADVKPFTPSSRPLLAAYRGAHLFIDTPPFERAAAHRGGLARGEGSHHRWQTVFLPPSNHTLTSVPSCVTAPGLIVGRMERNRKMPRASNTTLKPVAFELPPDRAFVLHLDVRAQPPRRVVGRVEHVTSGQWRTSPRCASCWLSWRRCCAKGFGATERWISRFALPHPRGERARF